MKRKNLSLILISSIMLNMFILTPSIVFAALDVGALAGRAGDINIQLQELYFKDRISGKGFVGLGLDGAGQYGGSYIFTAPNTMGMAALYTRYARSGNVECQNWADGVVYDKIKSIETNMLKNEEITAAAGKDIFLTAEQGMGLEFLSVSYDHSGDQFMLSLLENLYSSLINFEAKSVNPYGFDGAYWKAIDNTKAKYEPDNSYYYCYSNASLWAIIGMLKFGLSIRGTTSDSLQNYFSNSVTRAKVVIQFLEDYSFYNGSGFIEYPYQPLIGEKEFKLETQILGALAYTRLYQATEEQFYLDKAEAMIDYIVRSFVTTGTVGGAIHEYSTSTGEKSVIKYGYENALFAYVLLNLFTATGEAEVAHLRRAEEIAYFMNENLYKLSTNGDIAGYVEKLTNNTIISDRRLHTTQSLMLWVNEEIMFHERPWFIKYLWWIIIGVVAVLVTVFIIIGVKKKKDIGRKLPKLVKGLVED
jgi:hypothetical protein